MKLLHVITTLDVGGAEAHLLSQVRGQVERGHAVRVAWLKGEGRLAPEFAAAGAEWVGRVGSGPIALLRLRAPILWSDLVHSHLLKADVAAALAATLLGRRRRLVSSKHNDEQVLLNPLVSRVHGVIGNLPVRTIALSDHVARFVERHGRVRPERVRRIYYGLDRAPFERAARMDAEQRLAERRGIGLAGDDLVFVCVARFAPQKAHDVLLRAFARARASAELEQEGLAARLRLLLVGDDPYGDGRRRAESLAGELGLSRVDTGATPDGAAAAAVVFAGIRRDVPRLLAVSDAFVMSSRWEGLGLVFLEAMATGLPVLASDVSAVPEVVVHGETGLLVPPGDVDGLADGFVELARDGERRERMGAAGRERVREVFGLERMIEETLALYREVLEDGG